MHWTTLSPKAISSITVCLRLFDPSFYFGRRSQQIAKIVSDCDAEVAYIGDLLLIFFETDYIICNLCFNNFLTNDNNLIT